MCILLLIYREDTWRCPGMDVTAEGKDRDVDDSKTNTRLTLIMVIWYFNRGGLEGILWNDILEGDGHMAGLSTRTG